MNFTYDNSIGEILMKKLHYLWIALVFTIVAASSAWSGYTPSKERGDPKSEQATNIAGNQIRTTIFNFCFTGRTGVNATEIPFEWPANTGRDYIALNAIFLGAEVKNNPGDSIPIHIVDVPHYRSSPTGQTWNIEPVPGYFNPLKKSLAISNNKNTWPLTWPDKDTTAVDPGWPGSWNGYFGKDIFNADQEIFYKASDDKYNRYAYQPDSTDPSRKGMGMILDSRVMEWSQVLVQNVVYIIYDVLNDGTKNIPKFSINIWLADLVGGDGDSNDDHAFYDLRNAVAWSTDKDRRGNKFFGTDPVGVAGTSYLETPGNATDRIDNDGDGEVNSPTITNDMLVGEDPLDGIDNNGNGLIDENIADVSFGGRAFRQHPVGFADGIDNGGIPAEAGSPLVTQAMIDAAAADKWHRWPPNPETDPMQRGLTGRPIVHLIGVVQADLGKGFKDNIDNNGNCTDSLPRVTQAMINAAATDVYHRYRVPGTNIILYNLDSTSLGHKYLNQDGLRSAFVDEGIDEMIDESREDKIDNDGDWNVYTDDVGLDGVPNTHDYGEGDGKPTSGAGTTEPGEPHIDKTDVKESDQIGITRVQYLVAGGINFGTTPDLYFWATFFIPVTDSSEFYDPSINLLGDYDLFVSSGLFPLNSGQTERISTCVIIDGGTQASSVPEGIAQDTSLVLKDRYYAQQTYNHNYQFAKAPLEPTLTAVPGNGKVTLYWDDVAEHSPDPYLESIGALGKGQSTFEGYKIYKATDPAFLDAFTITDATGQPVFYKPVASFDLVDGIKGIDTLGQNGAHFDMGSDNGIAHQWVDDGVENGRTYYYQIRAYSKGAAWAGFGPSLSIRDVSLNSDGSVTVGKSAAVVVPNAPVAGYISDTSKNIPAIAGTSTGTISYNVVDPFKIVDGRRYRLTFEDTTFLASNISVTDTLTTKCYTLASIQDTAHPDTLISRDRQMTGEMPLIDGFRLAFANESFIQLNTSATGWNRPGVQRFNMQEFRLSLDHGVRKPSNYKIVMGDVGIDTSLKWKIPHYPITIPAKPVNFKIFNTNEHTQIKCTFWELDTVGGPGKLTSDLAEQDVIIFWEKNDRDSLIVTWQLQLAYDASKSFPAPGDTATIITSQPFLRNSIFEFTTAKQHVDATQATSELDRIKVVPNPYLVSANWEPPSPYTSGPWPRAIHFNHLPNNCVVNIFTANGELVRTLYHDLAHNSSATLVNGSETWDLLTRDNLPAAYGVYIYHVSAPGIGEKIGKFAIVK